MTTPKYKIMTIEKYKKLMKCWNTYNCDVCESNIDPKDGEHWDCCGDGCSKSICDYCVAEKKMMKWAKNGYRHCLTCYDGLPDDEKKINPFDEDSD